MLDLHVCTRVLRRRSRRHRDRGIRPKHLLRRLARHRRGGGGSVRAHLGSAVGAAVISIAEHGTPQTAFGRSFAAAGAFVVAGVVSLSILDRSNMQPRAEAPDHQAIERP